MRNDRSVGDAVKSKAKRAPRGSSAQPKNTSQPRKHARGVEEERSSGAHTDFNIKDTHKPPAIQPAPDEAEEGSEAESEDPTHDGTHDHPADEPSQPSVDAASRAAALVGSTAAGFPSVAWYHGTRGAPLLQYLQA